MLHVSLTRCTGSFVKGKRHGHGLYIYATGDSYDGEWESDVKHGRGVYTFAESGAKVSKCNCDVFAQFVDTLTHYLLKCYDALSQIL